MFAGTQTYNDILQLVATVLTLISVLELLLPELFPMDMLQVHIDIYNYFSLSVWFLEN